MTAPASRYTAILDYLIEKMGEIEDIGTFHPQQLMQAQFQSFIDSFFKRFREDNTTITQLRGWWFALEDLSPNFEMFGKVSYTYVINVHGIMTISSDIDSEARLIKLIEQVMEKLMVENDFSDISGIVGGGIEPIKLKEWDDRLYGQNAVHHCTLMITVKIDVGG